MLRSVPKGKCGIAGAANGSTPTPSSHDWRLPAISLHGPARCGASFQNLTQNSLKNLQYTLYHVRRT